MKSFYKSYVRAFLKFSREALENRQVFKTISQYAMAISEKANQLILRAALNAGIDLVKLRQEIYELGREYVHKFGEMIRQQYKKEKET